MNQGNNEIRQILKGLLTEELLDIIRNGERDLDAKKYNAFKTVLAELRNRFDDDDDISIQAGLLENDSPTSGWINISGKRISFTDFGFIPDVINEMSNMEIYTDGGDNVVISMVFYRIIKIKGLE